MRFIGGKLIVFFFIIILVITPLLPLGQACKDIIATQEATGQDYSLLLKVRDPSREGLQILFRLPAGTTYTYHYPWTGKPWQFTVSHTFLGVATQGDTFPNIVKAGMTLSDAGIAYGDADTGSNWKNPTKNAWDDFDWIRYTCQQASTENEAILLLTADAVDHLHASADSENLFVVGPNKAAIIEADAFHYTVNTIDDVCVMSNYPKTLWNTQVGKKRTVAYSFDTMKDTWTSKGRTVRLGSLCGVQIISITPEILTVRPVPYFIFKNTMNVTGDIQIPVGHQRLVGPYSVRFIETNEGKAHVSVVYLFKAWEDKMKEFITPTIGQITVEIMMNWSRLHGEDLDGLRPMCEDRFPYEAAMIFKIPTNHYDTLSGGWFSANHACSSIYVPIHICDTDCHEPYKNGLAAKLSLDLLHQYGHGNLTEPFHHVEKVLLFENNVAEDIAEAMLEQHLDITDFITSVDQGMQQQAYLTEQLWLNLSLLQKNNEYQEMKNILGTLWETNYSVSYQHMEQTMKLVSFSQETYQIQTILLQIMESIQTTQHTINQGYTNYKYQ